MVLCHRLRDIFMLLNLKEFAMTLTDDSTIAAAAMIGRAAETRANPMSASYGAAFAASFPFCFSIVRGSMASTRSCTIFKAVSSSFCRWPTVSSISLFLSASCELPSD